MQEDAREPNTIHEEGLKGRWKDARGRCRNACVHLPRSHLFGLLPLALLEDYHFWQNEDGTIVGTQPPRVRSSAKMDSVVYIFLQPSEALKQTDNVYDKFEANAMVRRFPLRADRSVDNTKPLTLLNLLYSKPDTPLHQLAQVCLFSPGPLPSPFTPEPVRFQNFSLVRPS